MSKEKLPNSTKEDSKHQEIKKKKLEDFTGEELDKMDDDESARLFAEAIVENLNDPANHNKSN